MSKGSIPLVAKEKKAQSKVCNQVNALTDSLGRLERLRCKEEGALMQIQGKILNAVISIMHCSLSPLVFHAFRL